MGTLQTGAGSANPNVAVSVGGHTLQFGTATASSGPGSLAVAVGTNSTAKLAATLFTLQAA